MKSAKEMFEELGYEENYGYGNDILEFINDKNIQTVKTIDFYLEDKEVKCMAFSLSGRHELGITAKLLEAINEMVRELGWLDE